MNKKPLKGAICYLSAPIEYDDSENWRPPIKKRLMDLGIDVFDPSDDPKQSRAAELIEAKETEDFDTVVDIAIDFIHKDLGKVDRSDLLIAYLPYKVPTVGTIHEIICAINRKIPVLLICPQGKKYISAWLFGLMKKRHKKHMFGNWDDLITYLEEVNAGKHKKEKRWAWLYGLI